MSGLDWVLGSDPAIRMQAMRDLTDAPAEEVAAERAKVATEGWGAQLLALQGDNGYWPTDTDEPEWISLLALLLLADMGLDPASPQARRALERFRDNATWHSSGPWGGDPVFAGEVEPCINGRVVRAGAYYGVDVGPVVDRLLGEQMDDGGWNCEQENGATVGSFHTTINVLEGLLEYERVTPGASAVAEARKRGEAYLLDRQMLRRLSTGEVIDSEWTQFSFPTGYHYDVLRGLEHMREAGVTPDDRVKEALRLVRTKQIADGRWLLENEHDGELVSARIRDMGFDMEEREGQPSRWNTLRAMRVLRWAEEAQFDA